MALEPIIPTSLPAAELLARAVAAGVTVELRDSRLRLRGKRKTEAVMRQLLAHKAEVIALLAGDDLLRATAPPPTPVGSAPAVPPDPEACQVLAEVLALVPRVNANWQSYITTRLEVDRDSAERLRRVRDWTLAHAEHNRPVAPAPLRVSLLSVPRSGSMRWESGYDGTGT